MRDIEKLEKALLSIIPNGCQLYLGNDKFLTGYLDGADKIYGFINADNEILVDGGSSSYPIRDLEDNDVNYIFRLSDIYKNILKKSISNRRTLKQ